MSREPGVVGDAPRRVYGEEFDHVSLQVPDQHLALLTVVVRTF